MDKLILAKFVNDEFVLGSILFSTIPHQTQNMDLVSKVFKRDSKINP